MDLVHLGPGRIDPFSNPVAYLGDRLKDDTIVIPIWCLLESKAALLILLIIGMVYLWQKQSGAIGDGATNRQMLPAADLQKGRRFITLTSAA